MKNTKLWASIAVFAMMFAGLACIIGGTAETSDGTTTKNEVEPLMIGAETPDTEFKDYNASYSKEKSTLTFNGGCDVTCNKENMVVLESTKEIDIVLNGETTLTSNFSEDDGNGQMVPIMCPCKISGPGTLNLVFSPEKDIDTFDFIICGANLTIDNCKINITDNSNTQGEGICAIMDFEIRNSEIVVKMGAGGEDSDKKAINGISNLYAENSILDASVGKCEHYSYGIYSESAITIKDCTVTAKAGGVTVYDEEEEYKSCGIYSGFGLNITNSIVNTSSDVGTTNTYTYGIFSMVMSVSNSKIDASAGKIGVESENTHGIFVGGDGAFKVLDSNIISHGQTSGIDAPNQPFLSSQEKIMGSNDNQNYEPIDDWEESTTYKFMKFESPYRISFDLKGGAGSPIDAIMVQTGDVITLPECDATLDGKYFYCWSDGYNAYQPGDKYTVGVGTTFYAIYSENAPPTPTDGGNDVTLIIVVLAVAIATGAILASAYFRKT